MGSRMLVQLSWTESQEWDKPLSDRLQKLWNKWTLDTEGVHTIKVPRCIKTRFKPYTNQMLIVTTDASTVALAAAAYMRTEYADGTFSCVLVGARGKVAPIKKPETVARLELAAAAIGVELAKDICIAYRMDATKVRYFTDSLTVLWWLRSCKPLTIFVATRVCRILDQSHVNQWSHIRTHLNPADLPTRLLDVAELRESTLWWEGAPFFQLPEDKWPTPPPMQETADVRAEQRKLESVLDGINLTHIVVPRSATDAAWLKLLGRWSSLAKARRMITWLRTFGHWAATRKFRTWNRESLTEVFQREHAAVRTHVIRLTQRQGLGDLEAGRNCHAPTPEKYRDVMPFKDIRGIWRVQGRLKHLRSLHPDVQFPILLPREGALTKAIVAEIHENLGHHGGRRTLLAEVRREFWIPQGVKVARRVIDDCQHCLSRNPVRLCQSQAPLHWSRWVLNKDAVNSGEMVSVNVFEHVGVDMAGPWETKNAPGKARHKRYAIIFSCLVTRMCNIEFVWGASGKECAMAFSRHCNRYRRPATVHSDRGTNFVRCSSEISELEAVWRQHAAELAIKTPEIKWRFSPAYSPRWTGHTEIQVRLVKQALLSVVRWPKHLLQDQELMTLFTEAQKMVNSRPLHDVSVSPHDWPPLRPQDFLLMNRPTLGLPPWNPNANYELRGEHWELDRAYKEVCDRFYTEYLLNLQQLKKNESETQEPHVGDIVVLTPPPTTDASVAMGVITAIYPGADGKPRAVDIERRRNGEVKKHERTLDGFLLLPQRSSPAEDRFLREETVMRV